MNNSIFFCVKNHIRFFCAVSLFSAANLYALTQSKEDAYLLKNNDTIRLVFIGSLLLLTLFIVSLYVFFSRRNNFRKKIKSKNLRINNLIIQNKKLQDEKEWLLKEIHDRVKNNLQIVISLLNAQSAYLHNEDALLAIQNSQHRMYTMSLIHQELYQSDNLSHIDMSWYIYELINYMKDCFDTGENIRFVLETEKTCLDVAQAIPLGLIINEAVSNSIKYAFPEKRKGQIKVSLKNVENNIYCLKIIDDGIGLPDNFKNKERNSLGMNLMNGLCDQIDGIFEMKNDTGLKITITFTKNTEFKAAVENSEMI